MFKYIDKPRLPTNLVESIIKQATDYHSDIVLPEFNKMQINNSIIDEIEKAYPTAVEGLGVPYDTIYNNTVFDYEGLATFTMIKVEGEILDWVLSNVCANINGLHIITMVGTHVFPHIDLLRSKAWNYVIDSSDAETCFYKPKEEHKHLPIFPRSYIPFERVDKIETIHIEEHKWHELDVTCIHGVENIKGMRILLSISFGAQ